MNDTIQMLHVGKEEREREGYYTTISRVSHIDKPRTDTRKKHTVLLILRIELGHDDIQSCLGRGWVWWCFCLAFW